MSVTREELFKSALELSEADRILLITELMGSIPGSLAGLDVDDPDFLAELNARANDKIPAVPWDEVQRLLQMDLDS